MCHVNFLFTIKTKDKKNPLQFYVFFVSNSNANNNNVLTQTFSCGNPNRDRPSAQDIAQVCPNTNWNGTWGLLQTVITKFNNNKNVHFGYVVLQVDILWCYLVVHLSVTTLHGSFNLKYLTYYVWLCKWNRKIQLPLLYTVTKLIAYYILGISHWLNQSKLQDSRCKGGFPP